MTIKKHPPCEKDSCILMYNVNSFNHLHFSISLENDIQLFLYGIFDTFFTLPDIRTYDVCIYLYENTFL